MTGLVISVKLDWNHQFFSPFGLKIWWMTPKINRTHLLYYIKLCTSFQIHWCIQTRATVRKSSIRVKIYDLSRVTLKFNGWPWKTTGHHFYAMISFVHHFKAIGEFKHKLQSGNTQSRSKSMNFCPVWPWNLMDDLEQGKSEGFDSCDRPSNLTQIGFKS